MAGQPIPKAELWVKNGTKYRIRSRSYGNFEAECIEAHSMWAMFRIVELNEILAESGFKVGGAIHVSGQHCQVEVIA